MRATLKEIGRKAKKMDRKIIREYKKLSYLSEVPALVAILYCEEKQENVTNLIAEYKQGNDDNKMMKFWNTLN